MQLDLFFSPTAPQQSDSVSGKEKGDGIKGQNDSNSFSSDESPETSHPRVKQQQTEEEKLMAAF